LAFLLAEYIKPLLVSERHLATSPFSKGVAAGRGIFLKEKLWFHKRIPLLSPFEKKGDDRFYFSSLAFLLAEYIKPLLVSERHLATSPFSKGVAEGRGIFIEEKFCFHKRIPLLSPSYPPLKKKGDDHFSFFRCPG